MVQFMAKLTKQGGLLLIDDETASNYSLDEILEADGLMHVTCLDTQTDL